MGSSDVTPEERLAVELAGPDQGYLRVRVLPDGSVAALQDLITTRAIVLGCTRWGWARRYCFANRALADARFDQLQSEDDEPEGFLTKRPLR